MNPQETQQVVARDEKWVPSTERVKISSTNVRLETTMHQKEETFQFIIDVIKNSTYFKAFTIIAEVPEIFMQQFSTLSRRVKSEEFTEVQDNDATLTFLIDLCYKGHVLQIWEDFAFQIDHINERKSRRETMPFPRFTKVIINHFLSQHKSLSNLKFQHYHIIKDDGNINKLKFFRIGEDYQEYGLLIPDMMLNDAIKQLKSYQMFLKYATGQIPPKNSIGKGSQGKKTADTLVADVDVFEESDSELARKRNASRRMRKLQGIFHATHARIVTESVPEPARRRPSSIAFKDTSRVSKKVSSDPSQKLTEKDVSELKKIDHSAKALATLKSEVPMVIEHILDLKSVMIFKSALYQAMHKNMSFNVNPANHAFYHALIIALIKDENAMDKGVADTLKNHKRRHDDDDDDDEDPSARPNQGKNTKRRITKESESSKKTSTTKKTPKDKLDWNNLEGDHYPFDLSKPLPLQGRQGHLTVAANYFFNIDLEFLKTFDPKKVYTMLITKTKVARYDTMGIEYMVPTLWRTIKHTYDKDAEKGIKHWGKKRKLWYKSQVNNFFKHNVYSTQKILGVKSVSVKKLHRYSHLEEIVVKRADRQLYNFKQCDFMDLHLNDIEDILFFTVQHKLFHPNGSDIVNFIVALRMFIRSLIIKCRVEDLQLGVKSYQKKLNITVPQKTFPEIEFKKLYTLSYKPPEVKTLMLSLW
nr:hypothetical protein [Tanacetum cinerariifolium]